MYNLYLIDAGKHFGRTVQDIVTIRGWILSKRKLGLLRFFLFYKC